MAAKRVASVLEGGALPTLPWVKMEAGGSSRTTFSSTETTMAASSPSPPPREPRCESIWGMRQEENGHGFGVNHTGLSQHGDDTR